MSFDPTLPENNTKVRASELRGQFNGLKALIDAVPSVTSAQIDTVTTLPPGSAATAGLSVSGGVLHLTLGIPSGATGASGPPFSQAVVDSVTTLAAGEPASVGGDFDGANVRFTFGIPRGSDGLPGPAGSDGSQGPQGNAGPPGPPFAQAVVDSVTTLDPGQPATVGVSFDGANVRFAFGLPRGRDGVDGSDGAPGAAGAPGEVSLAQLNGAISGTSANTNGVGTLDNAFADPDLEALRVKMNEMILNGRR